MIKNYDVAIVGGGIIGNSLAAHLASANLSTVVINSTSLGMPASVAAAGLLTPFQLHELENPLLKDFCFKSYEYFQTFYEMIKSNSKSANIDLGFRQPGSLYLIFSNFEIAQKENELKQFKSIIQGISFLNRQEVLKQEPLITKEIIGAYSYPNEGFINNPRFLKAISSYCIEKKVTFLEKEVIEINIRKNRIESITLNNGEIISANKFVLSNGAWTNKLLKKIFNTNEDIIKSIKGEIVQVEAISEQLLQKIIFCSDGYILPRPATNQFEKPSVLIGSTSEEVDIKDNTNIFNNTVSGVSTLTNLLQKLLPGYKNCPVIKLWAGLRPQTKDKLPILGHVEEIENLYCSTGHYRNGILMGPYSGKIIKDLIIENNLEYNIEPFRINRLFNSSYSKTLFASF